MLCKILRILIWALVWIQEKGVHLTSVGKQANEACSKQLESRTPKFLQGVYMIVGWMRIFPGSVRVARWLQNSGQADGIWENMTSIQCLGKSNYSWYGVSGKITGLKGDEKTPKPFSGKLSSFRKMNSSIWERTLLSD